MMGNKKFLSLAISLALGDLAFAAEVCPPGTSSADGLEPCTPCELGRYQPSEGQSSCLIADPGAYVDILGATAQIPASPGFFVPIAEASEQFACPAGRYQPEVGQSACLSASPGFFVADTGSTSQQACSAGTFSAVAGQSACTVASPGFFVAVTQAEEQTACAPGQFQDLSGQTSCKLSPAGTFVELSGQSAASVCQAGDYQPLTGQSTCLNASPGFFVAVTQAEEQTACAPGQFQDLSGQTSCKLSPAGTFVELSGQSAASECQPGSYQPSTGQSACLLASPGFFVGSDGAVAQSAAPIGTFVATAGSTAPLDCPVGTVSFGGSVACRSAPATGPNIVGPAFDSSAGRGGGLRVPGILTAPGPMGFQIEVSNTASAIGKADPLTRLTINDAAGSGVDGEITPGPAGPGTMLDEGQSTAFPLSVSSSRLGYVSLPLQVATDEGADLGAAGAQFDFDVVLGVDGEDLSTSIAADRPAVATGQPFTVRVDVANPGASTSAGNTVTVSMPSELDCSWSVGSEGGAIGSAEAIEQGLADTVSLSARARLTYLGRCTALAGQGSDLVMDTGLMPGIGVADLDSLNNDDIATITIAAADFGTTELELKLVSKTDFSVPDSAQSLVYELRNNGPDAVANAVLALMTFGRAEGVDLACSDQPGVSCGQLRQLGRDSNVIDTEVSLAVGQTRQFTLTMTPKTLESQRLKIVAAATLPPGWDALGAADSVEFTTSDGIFSASFEAGELPPISP